MKKKIIIIGAGLSGLTAGIYALDNGYDVTIYEKHRIAGGECTGWIRDNQYIDGCAHFIVGTNKNSELYPLWEHIGAFDEETNIHDMEYFSKFDIDGEILTIYSDLDKLKEELLRVSPIDKKQINRFINGIKTYQSVTIPTHKPIDKMNIFSLMCYGLKMLKMVPKLLAYMHTSVYNYSLKFKSPIIREFFNRVMNNEYNIHSLIYIFQAMSLNDAGVIEGGSSQIIKNIVSKYLEKGGILKLNSEIERIIIENNRAKGVIIKATGEEIHSDYVVASTDAYHTVFKLLGGKYYDDFYVKRFDDRKKYPLIQGMFSSFSVSKDFTDKPKMINFKIKPFTLGSFNVDYISLRNFAFDKVLSKYGRTTLTVLTDVDDTVYDYLKSLTREEYNQIKKAFGEHLRVAIKDYYKLSNDDIKTLDVATPLTYERYCNAYRGSYMSFITTDKTRGLMRKGYIKGVRNLVLSGQWIMPPGGLPIALFSGKHAIARICLHDKKQFIDLDLKFKRRKAKIA